MQDHIRPMQEAQADSPSGSLDNVSGERLLRRLLDDAWLSSPVIKAEQGASLTNLDNLHAAACEARDDAERRLASADASGYQAGRAAGYAEGLAQVLSGMVNEHARAERMLPRLHGIVEAAVRHVLCDTSGETAISGRVMQALQRVKYPANARLFVHPCRLDELCAWKEEVRTQFDSDHPVQRAVRQLEFHLDPALGALDLRLDFNSGLIEACLDIQIASLTAWLNAAVQSLDVRETPAP